MPQLQFSVDWPRLVELNVERVARGLKEREIDLLVLNNIDNVRYVTGFSLVNGPGLVHASWAAVAPSGDRTLWSYGFYLNSIRAAFPWIPDVRPLPLSMVDEIRDLAERLGAARGRIAFDGYLPYAAGKKLERAVSEAEILNADDLLSDIRMQKSESELSVIDRCVAIAEMGMNAALDACVEGVMEYEVAAVAEFAMRSAGAEGFPYPAVVASGENAAIMQELSTDKHLRNGEFVMIDLGCMFEGYYSDFARTALVGDRPHIPEQQEAYRVVFEALQAMLAAIRPGVTCATLDEIGRQVIRQAGWGDHEPTYPIGHGIGMTHWEAPLVDSSSQVELVPGTVLAVEPGIHKPGMGGLRLEEMVLVTEASNRVLTRTRFNNSLL